MQEPQLEIGQVWEELDPRSSRRVVILGISEPMKRQVRDRGGRPQFIQYRRVTIQAEHGTIVTNARSDRFNGKRGGYRLVSGQDAHRAR